MNEQDQAMNELRREARVNFFLVPVDREQIPVWVFKPAPYTDATAGLVINLSDGGIQVMTSGEEPLSQELLRLHLLLCRDEGDSQAQFVAQVRRVWHRPISQSRALNGFEFVEPVAAARQFLAEHQPAAADRRWLRCLLSNA